MDKGIKTRLALLEIAQTGNLKATVTFKDGTVKRLSVIDTVLAALHMARDEEPKITAIEWISPDKGDNGIMPQLAEYLIGDNSA